MYIAAPVTTAIKTVKTPAVAAILGLTGAAEDGKKPGNPQRGGVIAHHVVKNDLQRPRHCQAHRHLHECCSQRAGDELAMGPKQLTQKRRNATPRECR